MLPGVRDPSEHLLRKYTELYEVAPAGYFSLDPGGKILLVNLTGANLLGLEHSRLLGRMFVNHVIADLQPVFTAFLKSVFSSGLKQSCDLILIQDGLPLRMVNIEAERTSAGTDCQAVMKDISAQKMAESSVRASEVRYRRLFEAAHNGVMLLDPDTRKVTDANPFITKLLGYPHNQLVGKELFEIGLLRDAAASREMFRRLKRLKKICYDDLPLVAKDGTKYDVEVVANLYEESGRPVIQCNIRDITERKRTEATQRRADLLDFANQEANKELERRRMVEAALIVSEGAQRALLAESRELHLQLRNLTRSLITLQEDERKAISRELHDDVLQTLVGINVELGVIGNGPQIRAAALRRKIARTQRVVNGAISAVHGFARDLRPAVLDDFGLMPALEAYIVRLTARTKLKVQVTGGPVVETLDPAQRTVLFRVAQEALTNVTRHARATRVTLRISQVAELIRMEIGDNGRSFDVERIMRSKHPERLGLLGMKERIEMVGGRLAIISSPGHGTRVRVEIPAVKPAR